MANGLRFRGTLEIPVFKYREFKDALIAIIETEMKEAAREWLRAVIPKIPTWTGASRGTLQPLGRYINMNIPISPSSSPGAARAMRKGFNASYGASRSDFSFNNRGMLFTFTFDPGLEYLIANNAANLSPPFNLITPGPYGAFEAGEAAFNSYLATIESKVPTLDDFITLQKLSVGS